MIILCNVLTWCAISNVVVVDIVTLIYMTRNIIKHGLWVGKECFSHLASWQIYSMKKVWTILDYWKITLHCYPGQSFFGVSFCKSSPDTPAEMRKSRLCTTDWHPFWYLQRLWGLRLITGILSVNLIHWKLS